MLTSLLGTMLLGLVFLLAPSCAHADEERAPYTHVVAGDNGRCYAKSIPKSTTDPLVQQAGLTRVFRVREDNDMLVDEYDWYAPEIFIKCAGIGSGMDSIQIALVRRGPWHRGHSASPDHLALGFYIGGQLRKTWSSADIIAGAPDADAAISISKSHYRVLDTIPGFIWLAPDVGADSGRWAFEAVTVDGRHLLFDPATGELLE